MRMLPLMLGIGMVLAACGESSEPQATPSTKTQVPAAAQPDQGTRADTAWFNRGGDLNRASSLEEWRNADLDQRLASAADLLKMTATNLPAPNEAMEMARTLEAAITKAANAGEQGYVGGVVDLVFQEQGW